MWEVEDKSTRTMDPCISFWHDGYPQLPILNLRDDLKPRSSNYLLYL
jgi:hypothetical protein